MNTERKERDCLGNFVLHFVEKEEIAPTPLQGPNSKAGIIWPGKEKEFVSRSSQIKPDQARSSLETAY